MALLVYKRPELTRQVFAAVRAAQPRKLLVVADGPRDAVEASECREVRALIETGIDWDCELFADYAATNLGLAARVSSGLDWVFSKVERAIVLEDDTLPDPSFFEFCAQLLSHYERDSRVMQISGSNLAGRIATPYSYGFSKHAVPPWGWASWARAWEKYDLHLRWWPEKREVLQSQLGRGFRLWDSVFGRYDVSKSTWDVQWAATLWGNAGLCAVPRANLVSNLGFGEGATYTKSRQNPSSNLVRMQCEFPLQHPSGHAPDFDPFIEPILTAMIAEFLPQSSGLQRRVR